MKVWDTSLNGGNGGWETLGDLGNTDGSMPGSSSTQALTANIANYIENNQVRILVHTDNPSTESVAAELYTDLMRLNFEVTSQVFDLFPSEATHQAWTAAVEDVNSTILGDFKTTAFSNPGDYTSVGTDDGDYQVKDAELVTSPQGEVVYDTP